MLTFRVLCMLLQISNVHQSSGSLGCTTELQRSRWRTGLGSQWAQTQAQKRLSGFWVTNRVSERENWQCQTTTEDICQALGVLRCRWNWQEKRTVWQATSRICMSLGQADVKKPFHVDRRFRRDLRQSWEGQHHFHWSFPSSPLLNIGRSKCGICQAQGVVVTSLI